MAESLLMIPNDSHGMGQWPLTRELFAEKFSHPGSTIIDHDVFALHARQVLSDDRNFLGLFALDTLLSNRSGEFRRDDITPKSNHPLLVFFQVQNFIKADETKGTNYLPDRPDLDLVAALLHDEGEDIKGFTKEHLIKEMHKFIDNINNYVTQHNIDFPEIMLDYPTDTEIARMRDDVDGIANTFDVLTKEYKGQPKKDYVEYHRDVLEDARATRIKMIDKPCNGATFVYRSKDIMNNVEGSYNEYRNWVIDQIARMKDIYQNQNFLDNGHAGIFNSESDFHNRGFIRAAAKLHPQSADMIKVMGDVIESQIILYDHNVANERLGYESAEPPINAQTHQEMSLAPSVDLIEILQNRLEEVQRLDVERTGSSAKCGMFGIKFPEANSTMPAYTHIPLVNSGLRAAPT